MVYMIRSRTHTRPWSLWVYWLLPLVWLLPSTAFSQIVGFEEFPGGDPTMDGQQICDQYASLGVLFSLLDPVSGTVIGCPRIAKTGPPRTAFFGCEDDDLPLDPALGDSFLTDDLVVGGVSSDLLVEYTMPVSQTSGVIIDIDCATPTGPCEQWTVTARDAADAPLATVILDGLLGVGPGFCQFPQNGPGDSLAQEWSFDLPGQEIASVLIEFTGSTTTVGLAFDNFGPNLLPLPLEISVLGPANEICAGSKVELFADGPPLAGAIYIWEQETSPNVWTVFGSGNQAEVVAPTSPTAYRVTVTDFFGRMATSDPFPVSVVSGALEFACQERLLVSSYWNHRVLSYDPVTVTLAGTVVSDSLGGLQNPRGLDLMPDGRVLVASTGTDQVLRYDPGTMSFVDVFVPSGSFGLSLPRDLLVGPDGHLYVLGDGSDSVNRYDPGSGAFVDTFVSAGEGGLSFGTSMTFDESGGLQIVSANTNSVKSYDSSGNFVADLVASGSGGLSNPRGVAFGPNGDLFVCGGDVKRYDGNTGAFLETFIVNGSGTLSLPTDLLFGRDGNLYITSFSNDKVLRFGGQTGQFLDAFPAGGDLDGPHFLDFTSFCGDAQCDPSAGESICSCTADCGAAQVGESACGDGIDEDCDGLTDCADAECSTDPLCTPVAGTVNGLTVTTESGEIHLDWSPACAGDVDYVVYVGRIGLFESHSPLTCTTGGASSWILAPPSEDQYYLIAPRNLVWEGSHGQGSNGLERAGFVGCLPQQIATACE